MCRRLFVLTALCAAVYNYLTTSAGRERSDPPPLLLPANSSNSGGGSRLAAAARRQGGPGRPAAAAARRPAVANGGVTRGDQGRGRRLRPLRRWAVVPATEVGRRRRRSGQGRPAARPACASEQGRVVGDDRPCQRQGPDWLAAAASSSPLPRSLLLLFFDDKRTGRRRHSKILLLCTTPYSPPSKVVALTGIQNKNKNKNLEHEKRILNHNCYWLEVVEIRIQSLGRDCRNSIFTWSMASYKYLMSRLSSSSTTLSTFTRGATTFK
ncbi:hypothetical protein Taro_033781 [Colocasia esculenta]|uniref:Uncharacterized protein n=1 Tax=Colocasia esculenta TaxID=4460 RepID=A0A843W9Z6_COLES|nr:hypothetical protein [Colocasia esculenta]